MGEWRTITPTVPLSRRAWWTPSLVAVDKTLMSLSGLTGVVLSDSQTVGDMTTDPHGQRPDEDADASTGMAGSTLRYSSSIVGLALLAIGMSTLA